MTSLARLGRPRNDIKFSLSLRPQNVFMAGVAPNHPSQSNPRKDQEMKKSLFAILAAAAVTNRQAQAQPATAA